MHNLTHNHLRHPMLRALRWIHRLALFNCLAWGFAHTVQAATPATGHALIITVGTYENKTLVSLPGTRVDRESARQIAATLHIPAANMVWLSDHDATGTGIRDALDSLSKRVSPGDRVYLHFSGHGIRRFDPGVQACVEAFLAHDDKPGSELSNAALAKLLEPIARKTDKLFVMYDACHSGGMAAANRTPTRGWTGATEAGVLRPRAAPTEDRCAIPTNVRTRNLLVEQTERGALPQDIVYLAAARPDEISLDDENNGGLATQYVRDCLVRDAIDIDNSGTIDINEVRICAQKKINARLAGDDQFKPHNLVLEGNSAFVPVWFDRPLPQATATAPFSAQAALMEVYAQRNGKLAPKVKARQEQLQIDKDSLALDVSAEIPGWLYVFAAGSDDKDMHLLFPNALDQAHRVDAGQSLGIPRAHWKLTARGPAGVNRVMVILAPSRLPADVFQGHAKGDFLYIANQTASRIKLSQALAATASEACGQAGQCTRGFGAALIDIVEKH